MDEKKPVNIEQPTTSHDARVDKNLRLSTISVALTAISVALTAIVAIIASVQLYMYASLTPPIPPVIDPAYDSELVMDMLALVDECSGVSLSDVGVGWKGSAQDEVTRLRRFHWEYLTNEIFVVWPYNDPDGLGWTSKHIWSYAKLTNRGRFALEQLSEKHPSQRVACTDVLRVTTGEARGNRRSVTTCNDWGGSFYCRIAYKSKS